jgi:hypothetical protein
MVSKVAEAPMRINISAALLATALLQIGVSAASAAPDIGVTDGDVSAALGLGKNVVFRENNRFKWMHKTENVGTTTLSQTQTDIKIDSKRPAPGGLLGVPVLAPGGSRAGDGQFSVDFTNWMYGSYSTKICADAQNAIKAEDETNNCLFPAPIHVVPARLKGTISGRFESPPVMGVSYQNTWSANVDLKISRTIAGNVAVINYEFKRLKVTHTVQGTTRVPNCTYSGTATDEPLAPQKITLRFGLFSGKYTARNSFSEKFNVPITIKCPHVPPIPSIYKPTYEWFWTRGSKDFSNPGLDVLKGEAVEQAPGGVKVTWTWDLQATDIPSD